MPFSKQRAAVPRSPSRKERKEERSADLWSPKCLNGPLRSLRALRETAAVVSGSSVFWLDPDLFDGAVADEESIAGLIGDA